MRKGETDISLLAASSAAGYENLAAWADLLDAINIFPVADSDTGTNLRVSLSPLRHCDGNLSAAVQSLSLAAIGNSGNIAAAFLTTFLQSDTALAALAVQGREQAYKAIHKPVAGTMLDVFDALASCLSTDNPAAMTSSSLRHCLKDAVAETATRLAALGKAEVVDSGALGMFLFFDGFFQQYMNGRMSATPLIELFGDKLQLSASYEGQKSGEYCVEVVLAADKEHNGQPAAIFALGESAVITAGEKGTKVHLHTKDPSRLRRQLSGMGTILHWSDEAIDPQIQQQDEQQFAANRIRIMSDAAGSIPRSLAREYGIILLDSYVVSSDKALPESLCEGEKLYPLLKKGVRVTTAQASMNERYLHYEAGCRQHGKLLYICTGSAFTGNFAVAEKWKETRNREGQFFLLDSGAASGRLAVIALLTARFAKTGAVAAEVRTLAHCLSKEAEEFVFIDDLRYLVAGGRVSKAKGFFAGILHMKPVISPGFEGVQKVGVVRNAEAQISFALAKLAEKSKETQDLFVLLQFTDNREWLQQKVEQKIRKLLPYAEIQLVPLSLSSGVHMGPGTWSVAYAAQ